MLSFMDRLLVLCLVFCSWWVLPVLIGYNHGKIRRVPSRIWGYGNSVSINFAIQITNLTTFSMAAMLSMETSTDWSGRNCCLAGWWWCSFLSRWLSLPPFWDNWSLCACSCERHWNGFSDLNGTFAPLLWSAKAWQVIITSRVFQGFQASLFK